MPQYTENYSYAEPQYGEQADIEVLNRLVTAKVDENIYQTRRMMVDGFDDTKSYTTGDLVEYSNAIYRFIADKASGAWDSTKVELTTIADELATKGEGGADVTKTASGNPIEITDGANAPLVKCVTAIQGNQDLHGYDKSWVGGAGKNKLNPSAPVETFDLTGEGVYRYGASFEGNKTYTIINTSPSIDFYYRTPKADLSDRGSSVQILANSSATVTVPSDCILWLFVGLISAWTTYVSDFAVNIGNDTEFTPYSNICPITAYTDGEIVERGKNLFDISTAVSGYIDGNGNIVTYANFMASDFMRVDANTAYNLSFYRNATSGENGMRIAWYDNDNVFIRRDGTLEPTTVGLKSYSAVAPSNASYARVSMVSLDSSDFQFEKGETPTPYEPYTSTTHTATFSQAIYQGNADWVGSGATAEKIVIKVSDLTWNYDAVYNRFTTLIPNRKLTAVRTGFILSDSYESITDGRPIEDVPTYAIYNSGVDTAIFIHDPRYSTVSDFVSAMGNSEIAYEVASPTTETITPTNLPLKSLFGYNHIESSTGDMEIEYITSEYQPLVDLIESNSGKVTQDILYTASTMSETEIDVDLTAYDEYIIFANDVLVTTQIPQGSTFPRITFDVAITNNSSIVIYGYDDCSCIYTVSSNKLTYNSGRGGYRITMIIGVKVGDVSTSQTLNRSLRSLNLTKSAVDEIPEEIKNAEYEEKPDVNEAEDDAPTEEKR